MKNVTSLVIAALFAICSAGVFAASSVITDPAEADGPGAYTTISKLEVPEDSSGWICFWINGQWVCF